MGSSEERLKAYREILKEFSEMMEKGHTRGRGRRMLDTSLLRAAAHLYEARLQAERDHRVEIASQLERLCDKVWETLMPEYPLQQEEARSGDGRTD